MLRIFLFAIIAAIAFVVFRLIKVGRQLRRDDNAGTVEFPADPTFKNIEEADFEDLSSKPDPTDPDNKPG
jgi:hypothetical protein